jgi:hypothetical protein
MNREQKLGLDSLLLPEEAIKKMASPNIKGKPVPESLFTNIEYQDLTGAYFENSLRFICRVNRWNRLCMPGTGVPIDAKGLAYYFSNIKWYAGKGWPLYTERCPRSDTGTNTPYPLEKRHSIIVIFGGYGWPECLNSYADVGKEINQIYVGVNDDLFSDNTGDFEFTITGYSQ